ncbi:transposase family protein [Deferribacter autotrophicus]|uniref:Transposase family protein n=2 Tax=Deferribacter autotrophicus TaxID=500465 RepID=A0A5A8F818_9BACT|nr:transposase family protein [Deferribacter autotrophicus]
MDWLSWLVLSWKLDAVMDSKLSVFALAAAFEEYEPPKIFNSDQVSQYAA